MKNIKRLLKLILKYHKRLLLYTILVAIIALMIRFPIPYFTKIIIDEILPEGNRSLLNLLILVILIISLFSIGLGYLNAFLDLILNNKIGKLIAKDLFKHMFHLPFEFYDKWRTGDILSRVSDARSSITSLTSTISSTIISALQLLIFPAILFYISWELTLLALMVYPLDAWLCIQINNKLYKKGMVAAESQADYSSRTYEYVSSMKQIQAINIEKNALKEICDLIDLSIETRIDRDRTRIFATSLSQLIQAIGTFILLWLGWNWVIDGYLTIGDLIAFTAYASFLHAPLTNMFELSRQMQNIIISAKRYFEIADIPVEQDEKNKIELNSGEFVQPIRFSNIYFSYDNSQVILKNLNIEIPPNAITAIIGKNGTGKTTMISLIPRFYKATQGCITIGKIDIDNIHYSSLRSNISFMSQNSILFKGSILEQLTFGIDNVTTNDIKEVIKIVGLDDFINKLPNGLDTTLGEKGVGVSAGQQQRLLLARVFLQKKPIMIFDEATSALDIESEKQIMLSLQKMTSNHTIIIISHRVSAYEMADYIVELNGSQAKIEKNEIN